MLGDVWPYVTLLFGLLTIVLIVLLLMEREKRKPLTEETAKPAPSELFSRWPPVAARTVANNMIKETADKIRVLDLEREILSYAVRRLYEAQAEGKITEDERDGLMQKYRDDLGRIREEISRGESIVALGEMERMQEEFVKLFSDRFEELSGKIKELRTLSGIAAPEAIEPLVEELKEVKAPVVPPLKREREVSKPRTPAPKPEKAVAKSAAPEKGDAEKRIEQIMSEVEKVLEKLGQMEAEE